MTAKLRATIERVQGDDLRRKDLLRALAALQRPVNAEGVSLNFRSDPSETLVVSAVGDWIPPDPWRTRPDEHTVVKDLSEECRLCVFLNPSVYLVGRRMRRDAVEQARHAFKRLLRALGLPVRGGGSGRGGSGNGPLPAEIGIPVDWIRRAS